MSQEVHHISKELFDQLFEQYNNRLYGYILAITKSNIAAEELTQEIFIKLWLSKALLENVKDMDGYIFTIAKNKTLNYLRKAANDAEFLRQLQSFMTNRSSISTTEERIAKSNYDKLLGAALEQLSPQKRKVYELSRNEGMNMEEIANRMGIAKNTVKNHLVEALRFIRQYFGSHGQSILILLLFLAH